MNITIDGDGNMGVENDKSDDIESSEKGDAITPDKRIESNREAEKKFTLDLGIYLIGAGSIDTLANMGFTNN
nr:6415_t:CDS:2 [Entrophospora candida]